MTILQLMDSGMTYEQAVQVQLQVCAIMLIIAVVICIIEYIIKKCCTKLYNNLKQHNIF